MLSKESLRLCTIFVQILVLRIPFYRILEYLQACVFPHIPNRITTYELAYFSFTSAICRFGGIFVFFCIRAYLGEIASATSYFSYNIGCPCATAHNASPHLYTTWGYTDINSFKILFHTDLLWRDSILSQENICSWILPRPST